MLENSDSEEFIRTVYPEIREMAGRFLRGERPNHTLHRTALANETILQLLVKGQVQDLSEAGLLALAAHKMRLILVDYARKRAAQKRGGDVIHVPVVDCDHPLERDEEALLAMNTALDRLGELNKRALEVVELKFFAGCTTDETAAILKISDGTVEAVWQFARSWLFGALTRKARGSEL